MKAGPIEVGRLLLNRYRYCVPIYQRHYVWTRQRQWEPFWNDIRTKAIERLAGRERRFSHFMGAVVLEARGGFSARRVPSFQVVDGQQRLTTFQLFLMSARDYARQVGYASAAETISTYLLNDKPHLMEEPAVEVFKVWPTQFDRQLFTDLILSEGRQEIRKKYSQYFYATRDKIYDYSTVPSLLAGYGYFYERIRHAVETDDLDDEFAEELSEDEEDVASEDVSDLPREIKFDNLWQALVEEFKVVEITLEEGDDAQVIFETLNERGEPLLAADLVRNNIFHRAEASGEKAESLFATHWKLFESDFWGVQEKQGRYKKPRIEFFLGNYIAGQIASEVNLTKLFSEYKAFVRTQKFDNVAAEISQMARYGAVYRELIERSADSALVRFSKRLHLWDVTTVYPLVMRIWAASSLSDQEREQCLDMLLSFLVRRAVCGLTPKNYNKFFLMAIDHLDEKGWSAGNFATFLLGNKSEAGRFPRDEEFEERWINTSMYSLLQPAKTRAILEELEVAKRTKFHETTALAPNLTVEHVLPRDWEKAWPLPNGVVPTMDQTIQALYSSIEDDTDIGRIVRRNRLKQAVGNLTLLTQPLNSSVSNGTFEVKRAALEEHSLLVLNREITQHEEWSEETIIKRGKALFNLARRIWALPQVPVMDDEGKSEVETA